MCDDLQKTWWLVYTHIHNYVYNINDACAHTPVIDPILYMCNVHEKQSLCSLVCASSLLSRQEKFASTWSSNVFFSIYESNFVIFLMITMTRQVHTVRSMKNIVKKLLVFIFFFSCNAASMSAFAFPQVDQIRGNDNDPVRICMNEIRFFC